MPLISIAYLAFIGLGLPDPLPGTLWPELRPAYGVAVSALGILLAATTCGSFVASMLAGQAARGLGVGGVLALSVAATSVAALGQALAPPWALFVALALLGGLGAGAVDAALNAYAARHFAVRHLNWLHASWGIGATLGPALAAALLANGRSWRLVLAVVGSVLGALALLFLATRRRWADSASAPRTQSASVIAVLRRPVALLQVLVFLLYTGTEASAGQWAATVLTARGASPQAAAGTATLFWASLTLGRIGLGLLVDRIGPDRLVRWAAVVAAGAALLFAMSPASTDRVALVLLGAALSPLYPTLMARTPARLGLAASMHAVGFQVAAGTIGNALLPGVVGLVAERFGVAAAPPCIAVLAFALAVLVWRLPSSATNPAAGGSRG